MIVDDIREMIRWIFVGLEDYGIAFVLCNVINEISVDQIIERLASIAELESDAIFIVFCNLLCDLLRRKIPAEN